MRKKLNDKERLVEFVACKMFEMKDVLNGLRLFQGEEPLTDVEMVEVGYAALKKIEEEKL